MSNKEEYHGWANYETWNVMLWLNNDEGLYQLIRWCRSYSCILNVLASIGMEKTPDGVRYADESIDADEIDSHLIEE
jgi:hypothetical protein